MTNVLLIEDDQSTGAYVSRELQREGFCVDWVVDGQDGLSRARTRRHDVMVIDRMLPGLDGLELIRSVRGMPVKAPILVLTALGEVGDRVDGLRSGADDYLVKPFETAELVARLHALIRRAAGDRPVARSVGDLHIDLLTREARRGQRRIDLKPREFTLLEFLVRHQERVVTRAMILDQVWGFTFDPKTNFIETHISRLRAKLREGDEPELIHTVRGTGYIIREAS
jgi:two-component system OmpR family response regulator